MVAVGPGGLDRSGTRRTRGAGPAGTARDQRGARTGRAGPAADPARRPGGQRTPYERPPGTRSAPVSCNGSRRCPRARAGAAWLHGETERAPAEAARGFGLAVERGHPWYAGELAWWLWRAGQRPEVPEWVAEPYRLLLAGDRTGRTTDAWEALGHPYDQADALSCGDGDAALRALGLFDRLGAAAAAQRVRRMLRSRGQLRVPAVRARPRPAIRPTSPPAELEVLGMLSNGMRNAEIAARLSLSVRTVDHHVAAVLAKLAVGSRDQATRPRAGSASTCPKVGNRAAQARQPIPIRRPPAVARVIPDRTCAPLRRSAHDRGNGYGHRRAGTARLPGQVRDRPRAWPRPRTW